MKHRPLNGAMKAREKKDLMAAAAEALGGPAVKPPGLEMRKISRRPNVAAQTAAAAEAREAFELATGGKAQTAALGNTTFDGVPSEMQARRAKVEAARAGLAKLATAVLKAHEQITPILDDLKDDADGLKRAEAFDCEVARGFLNGLKTVVDGIAGPQTVSEEAAVPNGTEAIPNE